MRDQHGERIGLQHGKARGQARLRGIAPRHHGAAEAASPSAIQLRQQASHWPQAAVERELADQQEPLQRVRRHDADCTQNRDGDREIERRAPFAYIGRR